MTGTIWMATATTVAVTVVFGLLTLNAGVRVRQAMAEAEAEAEAARRKAVVQVVTVFNPRIQYLPDPTRDGELGAGLAGQVFLMASDGKYTFPAGDLMVTLELLQWNADAGPQPIPEVFHYDAATLAKLRTHDERFGDCYALFLPWPKEWKSVSQVKVSAKFIPTDERQQTVTSPVQTIKLKPPPDAEAKNTEEKTRPKVDLSNLPPLKLSK